MENMKCKGTKDMLPEDMHLFRHIENIFLNTCKLWNYHEVRTPTLEYLYLFTSAGTLSPNKLNTVYSFLDWDGWSGERVVLRPDNTIPVVRLYLEHLAQNKYVKLCYVNNVYSFESSGMENREKWQCGVEFLGSKEPESDVEIILLAQEILKNCGIKTASLNISHSGLVKSILKTLGISTEEYLQSKSIIKRGKWQSLEKKSKSNNDLKRLLTILLTAKGKSSGYIENIRSLKNLPSETSRYLESLYCITTILDSLECKYNIDIDIAHDFEYYTGLYFNFAHENQIICSGGRYDNLLPLMGKIRKPACGFAIYMDPLMQLLVNHENNQLCVGINVGKSPKDFIEAYKLMAALHKQGYIAEINYIDRRKTLQRWIVQISKNLKLTLIDTQSDNKKVFNDTKKLIKFLDSNCQ